MADRFSDLLRVGPGPSGSLLSGPGSGSGFLYGGLTMAVALSTAAATVDQTVAPMSMRTAFLSFGAWGRMEAEVDPVHDSRSFVHRRVMLRQRDRTIAAADITFHVPDEDPVEQHYPALDVPPPESLPRFETVTGGLDLIDLRPVRPATGPVPDGRVHPYWSRIQEDLGSSPVVNAAAIAFLSDYLVIFTPFEPGRGEAHTRRNFTLEHTVWFHTFAHAGEWLLFDAQPLIRSGGRYVSRGTVHDRRNQLVASFVQEGITRPAAAAEPMDRVRENP